MTRFVLSVYDFLMKRCWFAIVVLVAVIACGVYLVLNLNYKEDISDFLPQNDRTQKYTSVYKNIGGQDKVAIIFSATDDAGDDDVVNAMSCFEEKWDTIAQKHDIKEYQISIDEYEVLDVLEFINNNYHYFMTAADYQHIDSLLAEEEYVKNSLENNKQLLMLPTGGFLADNVRHDPLHLFTSLTQRLQSLSPESQYQIVDGYIFNNSLDKGFMFFNSPYGMSESQQNELLAETLNVAFAEVNAQYPEIEISAIGGPLIAVTNARQIKDDSWLAVSIAVILIFSVLIYAFRRIDDLLWIGASIAFGWLFALGIIALFYDSISIIVLGIGSVIIGIAVNYPLHYLDHLKTEKNKRAALKEMTPPLLIGNITTVSAFLCLVFLDADALRDLGLFGSLVLVGTILFVLFFLPLFVAAHKKNKVYFNVNIGSGITLPSPVKKAVLSVLVLITVVLCYFSRATSFDSDMNNINYMTERQRADLALLSDGVEQKDGKVCVFLVAEGSNIDEALTHNGRLLAMLAQDTIGRNVSVSGIGNLVPTKARQLENIKVWNSFWGGYPHIGDEIREKGEQVGFSERSFTDFISKLSVDAEEKHISYFEPILNLVENRFVFETDSLVQIVNYAYVADSDEEYVKSLINNLDESALLAFSQSDVSHQLTTILSDNFNYIGFVCSFVVFFFLWLSFGRFELSIISFMPLAIGWIWILGIMHLLDIQFNIVNVILATFIFGQGDDYTIFITEGLMYEYAYGRKTLQSYKNSIVLSAVIMLIGIGTLIFAKHPAMSSLAEVAIIGMLTVVVMACYVPSLMFRWVTVGKNGARQVPITIKRIVYTGVFYVEVAIAVAVLMLSRIMCFNRGGYIKLARRMSGFVLRHIPGVKYTRCEMVPENVCNSVLPYCGRSLIEVFCLLSYINGDVKIVASQNIKRQVKLVIGPMLCDDDVKQLKDNIGGNTRVVLLQSDSIDYDYVARIASDLGMSVSALIVHGVSDIFAQDDCLLREGQIAINCIPVSSAKELADAICEMARSEETLEYFIPYVKSKYIYKGIEIERRAKKQLAQIKKNIAKYPVPSADVRSMLIRNSLQGEIAWLYALVYKNIEIYAVADNDDFYDISKSCVGIPANLHFLKCENLEKSTDMVVDL